MVEYDVKKSYYVDKDLELIYNDDELIELLKRVKNNEDINEVKTNIVSDKKTSQKIQEIIKYLKNSKGNEKEIKRLIKMVGGLIGSVSNKKIEDKNWNGVVKDVTTKENTSIEFILKQTIIKLFEELE